MACDFEQGQPVAVASRCAAGVLAHVREPHLHPLPHGHGSGGGAYTGKVSPR